MHHTLGTCAQGLFSYELFFLNGTMFDSSYVLLPRTTLRAEPALELLFHCCTSPGAMERPQHVVKVYIFMHTCASLQHRHTL